MKTFYFRGTPYLGAQGGFRLGWDDLHSWPGLPSDIENYRNEELTIIAVFDMTTTPPTRFHQNSSYAHWDMTKFRPDYPRFFIDRSGDIRETGSDSEEPVLRGNES
jgi:hypothetical protein